jgi:hypothetical protein
MLSETLEYQAEWRRQKADEYPDDRRNIDAAELLERLAREVRNLEGRNDLRVCRVEKFFEEVGPDSGVRFLEVQSEYHRQIGFWKFPSSGGEYLDDLIELSKQAH